VRTRTNNNLESEKKLYANNVTVYIMCVQGTAGKLVQHLLLHNSAADPTYIDDFLLTYHTFLKSSTDITTQLLTWFDDPTHTDKVLCHIFFCFFSTIILFYFIYYGFICMVTWLIIYYTCYLRQGAL